MFINIIGGKYLLVEIQKQEICKVRNTETEVMQSKKYRNRSYAKCAGVEVDFICKGNCPCDDGKDYTAPAW